MSNQNQILVMGVDADLVEQLRYLIEFLGYGAAKRVGQSQWRKSLLEEGIPAAMILVYPEPGTLDGDIVTGIRDIAPKLPLLLTAESESDTNHDDGILDQIAVEIDLPLKRKQLEAALEYVSLSSDSRQVPKRPRSPELFRNLAGTSLAIQRIHKLIQAVSATPATVLITGESGTGKEVVARNVHYLSERRNRAFVPVNCGAIPADLLESELFGHEKGAFTGAISARQGRFEMAEGGTLFLDEIGDMSLTMQVKLLRVLQERTFERVGSSKSIYSDVRIIAATHINLEEAIAEGRFREDLFYRLNVFPIQMPPLRDRGDDLAALVSDLVEKIHHDTGINIRFTRTAMESMRRYSWPGNVRELANLIERMVILYPDGIIDVGDLPVKYQADGMLPETIESVDELGVLETTPADMLSANPGLPLSGIDLKEHLTNLEYTLIKQALQDANGVVAHAARRLKLGRTTLVEKMRKFGISREEESAGGI